MKKLFFVLFVGIFINLVFAESVTKKAVNKNISQNGYSIICASSDYTLASDKAGTFYLYSENWLTDDVYVYTESNQVSKDYVASKMKEASSSSKIIESRGYTVYYVSMGLFSDTFYFVKTPKANFYSVSKKVKTIHADGDSLIDEL